MPTVAAFGLYHSRKRIGGLRDELPGRASKLTMMSFSLEFAEVPQTSTNWAAGTVDVRRLSAAQLFDSKTGTSSRNYRRLPAQILPVIDPEDGQQWLRSRLFIS